MKHLLLTALAALLALPVCVEAQESEAYPSFVQVNGRSEKEVTPDEFYLQIVINERDSKGRISVEEQQRDMIAALKKIGIAVDKQLKMANVSSSYFKRNTSLAMAKYQLKLNSAAQMSAAWQALSDLEISDVSILKVGHSQMEKLKQEVRQAAIVNARSCAEELAGAIGQSVGKCFCIVDYNNDVMPVYYNNSMAFRSKGVSVSADEAVEEEQPLDFKTIKLSYNVQAKFVLE